MRVEVGPTAEKRFTMRFVELMRVLFQKRCKIGVRASIFIILLFVFGVIVVVVVVVVVVVDLVLFFLPEEESLDCWERFIWFLLLGFEEIGLRLLWVLRFGKDIYGLWKLFWAKFSEAFGRNFRRFLAEIFGGYFGWNFAKWRPRSVQIYIILTIYSKLFWVKSQPEGYNKKT